ncbi:MAG: sigma 54-interacting transcriptional regulator [Thermodesulfobacteriota bacterium]
MFLQSLKGKLIVGVTALVLVSGIVISLLVSRQYGQSLLEALTSQAENLAHAIALEAADKVLINDVVGLQKMLDHQLRSNPSIAYLFILRDGRIVAHTFSRGVPAGLIGANAPAGPAEGRLQKIAATAGDQYLDIAWPILEGKGGMLRLGFSEAPFKNQLIELWLKVILLILAILLVGLAGSLAYVRRITRPLAELVNATEKLDAGAWNVKVDARGSDEVGTLAASFNLMVGRIRDFTERLEEKSRELERSHEQQRVFCELVKEIGELPTLREVGPALVKRLARILSCGDTALLVINENKEALYCMSAAEYRMFGLRDQIDAVMAVLDRAGDKNLLLQEPAIRPPIVPESFDFATRQMIIPIVNDFNLRGALVIPCPGDCVCDLKEVDWVSLVLSQSAGVIRRAMLQQEAAACFQKQVEEAAGFRGLIGKDSKMQVVYRLIADIAKTDATVLIQGESGTGKELVARAIHQESHRRDKKFVVINCSAYPDTLLESELFGHERGAFTGAIRRRSGRFELADGGTVFLDEVGEIPPQAQVKLLRVLQTRQFERVGGSEALTVDVRVVAATNKLLADEVEKGKFRDDLFYRLNVIPIHLPPLRERRNDIPALANRFLRRFAAHQGKDIHGFSSEAMRLMLDYDWPGNVRELENSVEHAVVLAKRDQVDAHDLPHGRRNNVRRNAAPQTTSIRQSEKALLQQVLEECGWNKAEAARMLGIGRSTLYAKLRKYQLDKRVIQ